MRVNRGTHLETTERLLQTYAFVHVSLSVLKSVVSSPAAGLKNGIHGQGIYIQHGTSGCVTAFKRYHMHIKISAPGLSRGHDDDVRRDVKTIHLMVIGISNLVRVCRNIGHRIPFERQNKLSSDLLFDISMHDQRSNATSKRELQTRLLSTLTQYLWGVPKVNISGVHYTTLSTKTTTALKGQRWCTPQDLFQELHLILDDNSKNVPAALALQNMTAKILMQWDIYTRALKTPRGRLWAQSEAFKPLREAFWRDHGSLSGYICLLQALCATTRHTTYGWAYRAIDGFASARHHDHVNARYYLKAEALASTLCEEMEHGESLLLEALARDYSYDADLRDTLTSVRTVRAQELSLPELQDLAFALISVDIRQRLALVGECARPLVEMLSEGTTRKQFEERVVSTWKTCACCTQLGI